FSNRPTFPAPGIGAAVVKLPVKNGGDVRPLSRRTTNGVPPVELPSGLRVRPPTLPAYCTVWPLASASTCWKIRELLTWSARGCDPKMSPHMFGLNDELDKAPASGARGGAIAGSVGGTVGGTVGGRLGSNGTTGGRDGSNGTTGGGQSCGVA